MRLGLGRIASGLCLALCQCTSDPIAANSGNRVSATAAGRSADGGAAQISDAGRAGGAGSDADSGSAPGSSDAGTDCHDADSGNAPRSGCPDSGSDSGAQHSDAGKHTPDTSSDAASRADAGAARVEDSSCLIREVQLDAAGPFAFEATVLDSLKLWIPKLPALCKAPVIQLANGTGATCAHYKELLERLASHGFLTVCPETPTTGTGVPGFRALETVLDHYPELAAHKLGSLGHEAGGQGAILALQQAEATWGARASYAGLAIAPASGHGSQPPSGTWQEVYAAVVSPLLIVSIEGDAFVPESWVADGFDALSDTIEAYWYVALDAMHLPLPQAHMQELAVAWFRAQLLGDSAACAYFKQLPESPRWDARVVQNAPDCP